MDLYVDREIVLRFLGYSNKKPPRIIEKKIDEELKGYSKYLDPRYLMRKVEVSTVKEGSVKLGDTLVNSNYLYKKLKNNKEAYVVVYTIGEEIEAIIDKYSNNGEMMRAMILDKIGIVALDNLRDKLVEKIEEKESPKVVSSVSYPSQGDFEVGYQESLFKLFKNSDTTITINKGSQFSPIKTVLLVYGLGNEKANINICEDCDNKCH